MYTWLLLLATMQGGAYTEAPAAEAVAEEGADVYASSGWLADPNFIDVTDDGAGIFAKPQTKRAGADLGGAYADMWFESRYADGRMTKRLWRFWCDDRKLNFITEARYDARGRLDGSFTPNEAYPKTRARHAIPDSIGEAMMEFACPPK